MRKIEKNFLENNNYQLIELPKSNNVYSEISSHIDIFFTLNKKDDKYTNPPIFIFVPSR